MFIGKATFKDKLIMVSRDKHGKFFISMNGQRVGVKLNASEMCRWFLNCMNEEINEKPAIKKLTTEELHKQIKIFYKRGARIPAIKLVREQLDLGLKEALDYCNKVWNETN